MPKTIVLNENATVTGSVFCDVKTIRENFKSQQDQMLKAFEIAKSKLKVDDVKIHFRNIRQSKDVVHKGRYCSNTKTIEIDCKQFDLKSKVETIIHEMTHAKQWQDKKLAMKGQKYLFDKKTYAKPKTHEEYLELPWEVEARQTAKKHLASIMKEIA